MTSMHRGEWWVPVCVGLLAVSLSACTSAGTVPDAGTGEEPVETAEPIEGAEAEPLPVATAALPSGEIGSGSFTSPTGVTGRVMFLHGDDGVTVRILDLVTGADAVLVPAVVTDALDPDVTCLDHHRSGLTLGDVRAGDSSVPMGAAFADPSNIEQIVLTRKTSAQPAEAGTCIREVVARAEMAWGFAPLRSGLRAVDSGPTGGARGPVELMDDEPAIYTVAADDLLREVAARFGLTVDDLLYLNPGFGDSPYRELLAGDSLNLVVAGR